MKNTTFSIYIGGLLILFTSCNLNFSQPINLDAQTVLDNFETLSPEDGAKFYCDLRDEDNCLDSIYNHFVVPSLMDLSYVEVKNVLRHLENTPAYYNVNSIFEEKRLSLLNDIEDEVYDNEITYIELFVSDVLPIIELEVDSMVENDYREMINEYITTLNDNPEAHVDIKALWNKQVNKDGYWNMIDNYIATYRAEIHKVQSEYYRNITNKVLDIDYSDFTLIPIDIPFPDSLSQMATEFTDVKRKEIREQIEKESMDNKISIAIDIVTLGYGGMVYDIYSIGRDIYESFNKAPNPIEFEIEYYTINYICNTITKTYLQQVTEVVAEAVKYDTEIFLDKLEQEI